MTIIPFNLLFGAFESYPTSTVNLAFGRIYMSCQGNILDIINEPSSIINFNMKDGEVIWNKPFKINEVQQTVFASGFELGVRLIAQWKEFDFTGTPDLFGALALEILL
jgi:hypothetical protein